MVSPYEIVLLPAEIFNQPLNKRNRIVVHAGKVKTRISQKFPARLVIIAVVRDIN